ncbi:hypothetical protein ACEZDB_32270 [Streptacidiphilus sp. N1-3]|uniref:DUF3293 domain-containing protein n=1 Tax=Streptacidiphilus alkalitolerans TaxID=3342712 RepID=A0ABV6XAP8_9ACTN
MESAQNPLPQPGERLAAALAHFFTEWPMGDDKSALTTIAITDPGRPTGTLEIRAEEADALTALVVSEDTSYHNAHPDVDGPCGHCGGTGEPAGTRPAGELQHRLPTSGPGYAWRLQETVTTDGSDYALATVRYLVPCTVRSIIEAARKAVGSCPQLHDGAALIGLETGAISAAYTGGDCAGLPLYWDARATTLIYADGSRFPADLGDSEYDRLLTALSSSAPAQSGSHFLRVPLVREPTGEPVLVTVEATVHGPYLGLPTAPTQGPCSTYLFTRQTVCQIIDDLEADTRELTAVWEGDAVRFTWTAAHNGDSGTLLVLPDAHQRYPIGDGMWGWERWGSQLFATERQYAFVLGCTTYDSDIPDPSEPIGRNDFLRSRFEDDYLRGRAEARRLTVHHSES